MIKSKTIRLDNKKYFEMFLGKRVLKKDIYKSKGKIPVISANVFESVGYTNETIIKNFDKDFIIWGIDGDFEFNHIKKDFVFMPTDHCGCLRILNDMIFPEYLLYQLESNKIKYSYDRTLRPSLKSMGYFDIKIPIDKNDNFDIKIQKELVDRYNLLKELKNELKEKISELNSIKINIQSNLKDFKEFKIIDLLIPQSIPKKITKKDLLKNGKYVVYSSQFDNEGIVGYLNDFMFEPSKENIYFTFGDHTKALFKRDKPFSVIDNVKVLKLNKDFVDLIDLNYIKYSWINLIPNLGYTRHWKEAKNIRIKIPLDKDNNIDVKKQNIYSKKYININQIRKDLTSQIDSIIKTIVDIS